MKKIIHILFAPFRAIKNKLLNAIIKRLKITTDSVSDSLLYKLPDFEHDLSNKVLDKISAEDIAYNVDYHALGDEVDCNSVADHIDTSDIIYEMADRISPKDIADELDLDQLTDTLKKEVGIDLEAFNSRLDEIDAKQVDDSKYNDLVKTIKDLEDFIHEMQDEHKENYVRHTNRFQRQDEDLNRIENEYKENHIRNSKYLDDINEEQNKIHTELEENVIRINKSINQIHIEHNNLYSKTDKFVSRQWVLDAIEARAIELDEKINATLASTKDLYEPELKAFRVTFMDDFEAIDEKEAYDQLISYCEEVYRNQDVTAFNFEELND